MKHINKELKISFWASHFTTIVTVTLVLLLGGIISMLWLSANNETRRLKERMELTVILADSIPDSEGVRLANEIKRQPYAGVVRFTSKAEVMKEWSRDTGEDLETLFGVNPLSPEVAFTLKADYSSKAQIARIKKSIEGIKGVENVASPEDEMVDAMNQNLALVTMLLGIIAVIMLLITCVLINNTVHLSIYSRRFSIHTMQLVGATNGFIRRPIVLDNLLCGLISGVLASGVTALAMWGARESGVVDVATFLSWRDFGFVGAGMMLAGVLMCVVSSWLSATHYLHKEYDELFR